MIQYPLFLSFLNANYLNFLDRRSKNPQIPNFTKIRLVGTEMFHADGRTDRQTDMAKLIVAFRNFANAP